jgi:hypothetical protein
MSVRAACHGSETVGDSSWIQMAETTSRNGSNKLSGDGDLARTLRELEDLREAERLEYHVLEWRKEHLGKDRARSNETY